MGKLQQQAECPFYNDDADLVQEGHAHGAQQSYQIIAHEADNRRAAHCFNARDLCAEETEIHCENARDESREKSARVIRHTYRHTYAEKLDGHIRDPIESVEQGRKNFSENKYYEREYRGEEHEREQRGRGLDRGAPELIFFKQRRFQILPRAFVRIFCVIHLYPPACFF